MLPVVKLELVDIAIKSKLYFSYYDGVLILKLYCYALNCSFRHCTYKIHMMHNVFSPFMNDGKINVKKNGKLKIDYNYKLKLVGLK